LSEKHRVLVIDDEIEVGNFFKSFLEKKNMQVILAHSGEQARLLLHEQCYNLAMLDLKLPDACGLEMLREIKSVQPNCEVIMMTGYSTTRMAVKAIQLGAYDFLEKPFEKIDELEKLIDEAIYTSLGQVDSTALPRWGEPAERVGFVVGVTQLMHRLVTIAHKIAPKDINVLIHGETGTGKEVLARFIHEDSARSKKKFLAVNCGAFPESLLESELFGHEKGAFTGATSTRRGIFELADGGTLFLDEIGEASLAIQVKLLRVLETGEFMRMGGENSLKTNVRIIAATNMDLEQAIKEKAFREDLFYRLDVIRLVLPPLRKRAEDIPLLTRYFVEKFSAEAGYDNLRVSPEFLRIMNQYDWPGNIRELANTVKQAVALCDGKELTPLHLNEKIGFSDAYVNQTVEKTEAQPADNWKDGDNPVSILHLAKEFPWEQLPAEQLLTANQLVQTLARRLEQAMVSRRLTDDRSLNLQEIEQQSITRVLSLYDNNFSSAARALGIARSTLYRKVKEHGIL
jgi:two-component system NtrC family response regulator